MFREWKWNKWKKVKMWVWRFKALINWWKWPGYFYKKTKFLQKKWKFFQFCMIKELKVLKKKMLFKTPERTDPRSRGQRERLPPQSFLSMCPFFLMGLLNVLFLKEVTQNIHENRQASHEQIKIKYNTLKRSSFFV